MPSITVSLHEIETDSGRSCTGHREREIQQGRGSERKGEGDRGQRRDWVQAVERQEGLF